MNHLFQKTAAVNGILDVFENTLREGIHDKSTVRYCSECKRINLFIEPYDNRMEIFLEGVLVVGLYFYPDNKTWDYYKSEVDYYIKRRLGGLIEDIFERYKRVRDGKGERTLGHTDETFSW